MTLYFQKDSVPFTPADHDFVAGQASGSIFESLTWVNVRKLLAVPAAWLTVQPRDDSFPRFMPFRDTALKYVESTSIRYAPNRLKAILIPRSQKADEQLRLKRMYVRLEKQLPGSPYPPARCAPEEEEENKSLAGKLEDMSISSRSVMPSIGQAKTLPVAKGILPTKDTCQTTVSATATTDLDSRAIQSNGVATGGALPKTLDPETIQTLKQQHLAVAELAYARRDLTELRERYAAFGPQASDLVAQLLCAEEMAQKLVVESITAAYQRT